METERKLKMLQTFYAAVLADSVLRLGREGVLDKVTEEKKREQLLSGKMKAQQLGISVPEEAIEVLSEIFGCADWKIIKEEGGFVAEAKACMLCAIAKKLGANCPCNIYCLDPIEGVIKGLKPEADYIVESTLWDCDKCRLMVKY